MNNLLLQHDVMVHISSFLDSLTLLSSLPISSSYYSVITHENVWKGRWIWRDNHHKIPLNYSTYRLIRNLEMELIMDCREIFENSTLHPSKYDHKYANMELWTLECLLSLCDHIECYHNTHEDYFLQSLEFLTHLGVKRTIFENKKYYRLIQHFHATIKYYVSKGKWSTFFHRVQDPLLPSFYKDISVIVIEGLVHIAELQPFGCNHSGIDDFVLSLVERTWKKVGELFQSHELLQSSARLFFPSVGWSLSRYSKLLGEIDMVTFLRRRQLVASYDRVMILRILIEVFIHDLHFEGAGELQYYGRENSLIDHVVANRRGIPLTGCSLFQYCAYCVGLTSMAMIGLPGHIILGLNTNLSNEAYIYHPQDTLFIDIHRGGALYTVAEAINFFSLSIPRHMNIDADQVLLPELFSSMNCSTIFLRAINNLILAHNRATSPSSYRSMEFLAVILSYLHTQMIVLLSSLSLSTATSPIPPSLPSTPPIVWNISNIAIFQKFFMIAKDLQLKALFDNRMEELQHLHDTPSVLLAHTLPDIL